MSPESAIKAILFLFSANLCIGFLTNIEKKFRLAPYPIIQEYLPWSLSFFKVSRTILIFMGSFEIFIIGFFSIACFAIGISLILSGFCLRFAAIKTLGPIWTYKLAKVQGHYLINRGIYRYLKHPAYLGNMYLVGILLSGGAIYCSILSFLVVLVFSLLRIRVEDKLLLTLRDI